MALGITSKNSNIKRSLEKYVEDNIGTDGEGLILDLEGTPFETTNKQEWVQFRTMFIPGDFLRQGSATEYAEDASVMANFNIFVQESSVTVADKHYKIRDWITNYFKIGQSIGLYDYVSGATTANSYMKVREIITDTPIPASEKTKGDENFLQYSLSYGIRWTSLTPSP